MASFNKVILAGNATRDPEIKYVGEGTAIAEFGLAVNRKYKDKEEVTFVDITFFGKQAEVLGEYLTKGGSILVEGRLKLDTWENQEGERRSKLNVVGESFQFLGGKSEGGGSEAPKAAKKTRSKPATPEFDGPDDDSDIPF